MKKLILLFFVFTSTLLHAQLPMKDGKVFYEKIDTCSLNKMQLYSTTKLWFLNTFKDSKAVLEVDDKDNGEIAGKGIFNSSYSDSSLNAVVKYICQFTIRMSIKDKKYRIQIYDINITLPDLPVGNNTVAVENIPKDNEIKYSLSDEINAIINSYSRNVTKKDSF